MDFDRPLWELWVFENYTDDSGKACSMIMMRLHHCMLDGFTGLRCTPGFFIYDLFTDRKSSILGVWAAPGGREIFQNRRFPVGQKIIY